MAPDPSQETLSIFTTHDAEAPRRFGIFQRARAQGPDSRCGTVCQELPEQEQASFDGGLGDRQKTQTLKKLSLCELELEVGMN